MNDSQEEDIDDDEKEYEEDEDDVSHAMNDLQQTLAELHDIEEQILKSNGDLIKDSHRWMVEYEKIYEETIKVVDYDREEHAKRLNNVIRQNMEVLRIYNLNWVCLKIVLLKKKKLANQFNIQYLKLENNDDRNNNNNVIKYVFFFFFVYYFN